MKLRPPDFENPYPTYSTALEWPSVTLAQIGVQSPGSEWPEGARALLAEIEASLGAPNGPDRHERCGHVDAQGHTNEIVLAYWRERADYDAWASGAARAWSETVPDGEVGWWREVLSTPSEQMETSYSSDHVRWGLAASFPKCPQAFSGYFGAMRDRIEAAEDGGLPGELEALAPPREADSRGRRITVPAPDHLCFTRASQGWASCPDEERRYYLEELQPVYFRAMEYLRDNPEEAGSASIRVTDVRDDLGVQTSTLGWFVSLVALERWAHTHPTHLAILKGAAELMQRFAPDIHLLLGHEVYVPRGEDVVLEYANCHGMTGFLPFADLMRDARRARTASTPAPLGASR